MNKTIWALAFVVLACGVSFAIGNATAAWTEQNKFPGGVDEAGNVITEGGNVTWVDVGTNASTEKWAGFYGNVTGQLVLAEFANAPYMYSWAYNADTANGTVCASTGPNVVWTVLGATVGSAIDGLWIFTGTDADSAANTLNETGSVTLNEVSEGPSASVITTGGWETVALNATSGAAAVKDEVAFCVSIDPSGSAFNDADAQFQLMAPTNEAVGTTEEYFFYLELI